MPDNINPTETKSKTKLLVPLLVILGLAAAGLIAAYLIFRTPSKTPIRESEGGGGGGQKSLSITAPTEGATVSGAVVPITATVYPATAGLSYAFYRNPNNEPDLAQGVTTYRGTMCDSNITSGNTKLLCGIPVAKFRVMTTAIGETLSGVGHNNCANHDSCCHIADYAPARNKTQRGLVYCGVDAKSITVLASASDKLINKNNVDYFTTVWQRFDVGGHHSATGQWDPNMPNLVLNAENNWHASWSSTWDDDGDQKVNSVDFTLNWSVSGYLEGYTMAVTHDTNNGDDDKAAGFWGIGQFAMKTAVPDPIEKLRVYQGSMCDPNITAGNTQNLCGAPTSTFRVMTTSIGETLTGSGHNDCSKHDSCCHIEDYGPVRSGTQRGLVWCNIGDKTFTVPASATDRLINKNNVDYFTTVWQRFDVGGHHNASGQWDINMPNLVLNQANGWYMQFSGMDQDDNDPREFGLTIRLNWNAVTGYLDSYTMRAYHYNGDGNDDKAGGFWGIGQFAMKNVPVVSPSQCTGTSCPSSITWDTSQVLDGGYRLFAEAFQGTSKIPLVTSPLRNVIVKNTVCVPTICAGLGYLCGQADDGCGGVLNCGSCPASQTCNSATHQCQSQCTPTTCAALGALCGTPDNGCGMPLNCGVCGAGQSCSPSYQCISASGGGGGGTLPIRELEGSTPGSN